MCNTHKVPLKKTYRLRRYIYSRCIGIHLRTCIYIHASLMSACDELLAALRSCYPLCDGTARALFWRYLARAQVLVMSFIGIYIGTCVRGALERFGVVVAALSADLRSAKNRDARRRATRSAHTVPRRSFSPECLYIHISILLTSTKWTVFHRIHYSHK